MIKAAKENKADAKDVQEWVDSSLKSSELFGPRFLLKHQVRILTALQGRPEFVNVAAETARKISKQIDPKAPLDMQMQLYSSVAEALRNAKQKDEAVAFDARIEKLEGQAYAEYAKDSLNYKPVKYAGRKGKSDRAMLVELFTGAQCPPCVAADLAFDGLEKTYGPSEVVLLQYHLHVPRPEPMANADADNRFKFYAAAYQQKVRGCPTGLFNGKPDVAGGGSRAEAPEIYQDFCEYINKRLEIPTTVKLSVKAAHTQGRQGHHPRQGHGARQARRQGAAAARPGRGLGPLQRRQRHAVSPPRRGQVRAMPGGVNGIALKAKGEEHTASVDLAALRKTLNNYLDEEYPEGPRPMRMRHLHVVAFVQDDATTEVLQAIDVAVKDE